LKVVLKIANKQKVAEQACSLYENFVIGRGSEATCKVEDSKVSSKHCRLNLKNDRLEVFDLESKNGTYLNGIRVDQSEVFIGDEIKVGDTTISLMEARMESIYVDILTFPGPHKDRMNYELKADFTGARIQNQLFDKDQPMAANFISPAHVQEIAIRRKVESNLRLSKQEIKIKNQNLVYASIAIDLVIVFGLCGLTYFYITEKAGEGFLGMTQEDFDGWKTHILGGLELLILAIFYGLSKTTKFTIGERLSGLEEKYSKQNP
jgi:FHA domain